MQAVEVIHQDGYRFVRVSRAWAKMCSVLPCFDRIRWPDYAAIAIDTRINGVPVVIQLWKGWCPRFLGSAHMPGGIGGEVGVYRRKETGQQVVAKPKVHRALQAGRGASKPAHRVAAAAGKASRALRSARHTAQHALHAAGSEVHPAVNTVASDDRLWWPAPELHANLQFELLWKGQVFFRTEVLKDTYWLTQWMDRDDYTRRYRLSHDTPVFAWEFTQRYWINGVQQPDWVGHHG